MSIAPDSITAFVIYGVVGAWLLAWIGILVMRRYYNRRLERLGESSSEEIIDELETAYLPAAQVRIRTQTEYLPFLIETIRENIDSGLDDHQVQTLLLRVENHHPGDERHAVFPVEADGLTSDLRLTWIRDSQDRIDLRVRAAPVIVRALRDQKKRIPKAVIQKKRNAGPTRGNDNSP